MLVKKLSRARVIVRTSSVEYLEAWREREIDVDFMVSSELETANAISGLIGIPAARQTDVFADGKVQIVEFDVPDEAPTGPVIGRPLREAEIPGDSKVVAHHPRRASCCARSGDESIEPGDRIVVIALARVGARVEPPDRPQRPGDRRHRHLRRRPDGHDDRPRAARPRHPRAARRRRSRACARGGRGRCRTRACSARTRSTPSSSSASGSGSASAAVFALNDDAKNLFGAVLARVHGVQLTIALAHDPAPSRSTSAAASTSPSTRAR